MCGIVGLLEFSGRPPSRRETEAMMARVRHRGPDGEGVHVDAPVALGHRRLSIIDLASGSQPMTNEDGRVWITYNGELYNFRELRSELEAAGHSFRTACDTEVIVHAWEEWGERCVERFRGMFAFVIADYRQRMLFLARDHLGIKPLYYFKTQGRFAFASELQALAALPDCPHDIDPQALDDYLAWSYIPPPRTIYRNVGKLPPATRMTVTFDGRTTGPQAYWTLRFHPEQGASFGEWTERLEAALRDSVRAHLMSDVPFGAFLSGGIDSTAVVALMSEELSQPVRTFCIGFEEQDYSEVEYARVVARRFATDHHEEIVRPDALSILPQLVRHYGEPFGDSSAIPTFYVSRLARRHVTMALSGDGGDEAFLGYGRYFEWFNWINPSTYRRAPWKRWLRRPLSAVLPGRFPSRRMVEPRDWLPRIRNLDAAFRRSMWRPEYAHVVDEAVDEVDRVLHDAADVSPEQFGQYIDYRTYLPHDILTKVDIASMCHSLESRTPLTDVRVAEFAGTIPWTMNLQRIGDGQWTGKHLLKRIVRKYFGADFVERKKTGFGVPLTHWFAKGGALRAELDARLRAPDAAIYRYFRPETIRHMIEAHRADNYGSAQALWQLLFLENWLHLVHDATSRDRVAVPVPA